MSEICGADQTSVTHACNEIGFYRIETEDLEPKALQGHDPEQVEKLFAALEAEAAPIVEGLLEVRLPTTEHQAFNLALLSHRSRRAGGSSAKT